MTFQRARSAEQRELRRQAILDTAAAMLDEMPVAEISLNELSRRVGLAKSNVLRYFESREAVLFELLAQALASWLAQVPEELAAGVHQGASVRERGDQVAAVLSASLARQAVLLDLLNAQHGVLEHNVSVEALVRFKRSAIASIASIADLIRRHLPELGDDAQTVVMMTLMLAGTLSSHCRPSASALAAYETDPTLVSLPLDLRTTLENTVATLIAGTLART
ncbi:TetR/AcrR family transcriptional regulator [Saccharothrix luteola]|uniref:TetR/AcrR family transcriptional regulator n=1 Tax=Saccharothrix luteola TaxID=2893018 RepID=UPI001E636D03|nr:TetR family transcriptional regulator [Saccharothrix luteola]MCC8245019.1 TetR family transcriptional regulator [Saccharothrix luteola]